MNELDNKLKEAAEIAVKKKTEGRGMNVMIDKDDYYVFFECKKKEEYE